MAREKDPHTGRDHAERTALMRRRNAASPRSGATRMRTSPTTISTSGTGAPGGTSSFCLFRKALRQPNSCGGEIPRRRASAETLMPGSSAAVTACALYFRPTAPLADRRTVQPLNERPDQLQATSRRHRRRTGRRHGTSAIRATPEAYPRPDMPLTHGGLFPLTLAGRHLQDVRREPGRLHRRHAACHPRRSPAKPHRRPDALALQPAVKPRRIG